MDYSGKIITKNPVEPSQTSAPGVWTLDQATQAVQGNNWPIAYVPNPISRSLRFNSADSAYLNRTPASAGNRKTWTWSGWVKRSALTTGSIQGLFAGVDSSNAQIVTGFRFRADDALELISYNAGYTSQLITSQVFRDVSSWYHLVAIYDTTQATSTNRVKIYVNGSQVTSFSTATYPSQNYDAFVNTNGLHVVGAAIFGSVIEHLAGYLTEINFIDGQALDPTYFGMTDPRTGAWIPKKYSGTYGTNGFYLNFSDNSTTAALGTDYSGNSNTWTTNNFSVTAGSGNDSMTDVPTPWIPYNTTGDVGGVVRGNYCTWNPLYKPVSVGTAFTYTDGNLQTQGNDAGIPGTIGVSSGKWYWEVNCLNYTGVMRAAPGIVSKTATDKGGTYDSTTANGYDGFLGPAYGYYNSDGNKFNVGTSAAYGASWTEGDIIGVAFDADNWTLTFYKNGVSQGTAFTGITPDTYFPLYWTAYINTCIANFGQRPFAYTPPAGFKSLCTTNLPEPTILDGGDYFNAVLWTGTGGNRSITGVGFQPDLVWAKSRSNVWWNVLFDSVRGSGQLSSNQTDAELASGSSVAGYVSSYDVDGFSTTAGSSSNGTFNASGDTYVAWNWKESATAGFDIVTYTGDGTSNRTINHNLGVAPYMIITKERSGTNPWLVQFNASTNTDQYLYLNSTAGYATYAGYFLAATSTTYGWGTSDPGGNGNALTYVSYLFAAVPGFSAFGSYTGNGSTDGTFIYTGFRPRWILYKPTNVSGTDWVLWDTTRNPYNICTQYLLANTSGAEGSVPVIDVLSNGFKQRVTSVGNNASGNEIIYAAFAENPFKYSNAR